jgi:hypothetical protein
MTIEQIQAAIDSKANDPRQLINMIADYLQANPGGGSPGSSYLVYTASISQTSTDVPSDGNGGDGFENTLGDIVNWTRTRAGVYKGITNILAANQAKCIMSGTGVSSGTGNSITLTISDYAAIIGYLIIQISNNGTNVIISIECLDAAFAEAEISTLFGSGNKISLPDFKYFSNA